ncbi:MAG: hypothetical protein WAX66_04575, partial [Patescibacteria group bacterium]
MFTPCTENLYSPPYIKVTGRSPFKAVNNATVAMKTKYGYLPRITLFKALRRDGFQIFLKIEFSVPKILYGNNFDEVIDQDIENICIKLKDLLFNMGVIIRKTEYLKYALVSTLHYSKNIILQDYSTPFLYLKEFQRADISKIYDTNKTDFRNEGHAVKFHSNDYEVILYDKLKVLQQARKSEKRAVERDNYGQLNLLTNLRPVQPFEVLRIEVRFGSRRKIKQVFNKEGFKYKDLTFIEVFKKEYSRKLLMNTLIQIDNSIPAVLNSEPESLEKFVIKLRLNNPNLNYSQILKIVGAKALYTELGLRGFRDVTDKSNSTAWYRLKKQLKNLNFDKRDMQLCKIIDEIKNFKTVRLEE